MTTARPTPHDRWIHARDATRPSRRQYGTRHEPQPRDATGFYTRGRAT